MVTENLIDLDKKQLRLLKTIIKTCIPGKTVWAYGSRVFWKARENSDLDLAVFDCSSKEIYLFKEALDESNLLISIDVMNWNSIPEDFKQKIKKKYVILQENISDTQKNNIEVSIQSQLSSKSKSSLRSSSFPRTRESSQKNAFSKLTQQPILKGWRKMKLGDVIDVKHGFAFRGQNITTNPTNKILVTPGNFHVGGGFKSSKYKYFNGNIPKDYILKKNDLIVTMTDLSKDSDTLGCPAKIPKNKDDKIYLHNQRIGLVQLKTKEVNKNFIYYTMCSRSYHWFIICSSSGTSIRHTSPDRIKEYDFFLPPLSEQKAIAEVLSSLDDKIELLHEQNKTLEDMAQTLFRKWFITEAQPHWKEKPLGELLETIESGSRPKGGIDPALKEGIPSIGAESINGIGKFDFSKTKYITDDFFKNMKKSVIKDYDILIYKDGAYIGRKAMFGKAFPFKKMAVNEHVFILRTNNKIDQFFIYFSLEQKNLSKLNANSAQPGLNQKSIKSLEIIVPPKEIMNSFSSIVKPWIDKILFNSNQIRKLENTRNLLLPKLMSGQVRVKH